MDKALKKILADFTKNEGNIISLLQNIQDAFGYIPEDAVYCFSKELDIPASRFFGIATFYAQFHLSPRGKNIVTTCCGTACHVKGSERLLNGLKTELNLPEGEHTTSDREITIEKVNCVGACSIAPVVIINKKVHGKISADKLMKEIRLLRKQ
ncbi:MAG: NAD(P)H-dependent oxidoreductase subunit E [Nitrospiraceae bacterium]|nr:MAG: NAD(P)H-dependent oxidoreductase subunit E [Nitrospiraceae bacterium]